jgi:uncharacterized protein (DUF1501 family)
MNAPRTPIAMSRRQVLQMLGLTGAGFMLDACGGTNATTEASAKTPTTGKLAKAAKGATPASTDGNPPKTLVVIELQGGHDGFAMLVPYGDGRFHKLRDRIWIDPKELHILDDRYALAKGLAPVAEHLAFVEGVGVAKPDLSHFAMLQRWWQGDPVGDTGILTGFLGRCCDSLAAHEPVTGISIGGGSTPALIAAKATTVSMPQLDAVRELANDEPDQRRVRQALRSVAAGKSGLGDPDTDRLLAMARAGLDAGIDLSAMVGSVTETPKSYPDGNDLAASLASIRQLISAGTGIRVFHIPWGSFDTHTNEVGTHTDHMNRLGAALAAFRDDLEANGLADRVLVATTSEFGRRPEANAGGTDHGTASSMLLMGPVKTGRHGAPVDFGRLNDEGNVRATVSMTDYYATLAHWLGASPSDVLTGAATPIDTLRI